MSCFWLCRHNKSALTSYSFPTTDILIFRCCHWHVKGENITLRSLCRCVNNNTKSMIDIKMQSIWAILQNLMGVVAVVHRLSFFAYIRTCMYEPHHCACPENHNWFYCLALNFRHWLPCDALVTRNTPLTFPAKLQNAWLRLIRK